MTASIAMSTMAGMKSGVGERDGSFGFAYATVFGWPANWGTWYDVRDDLSFSNDVLPVFGYQLYLLQQGDLETFAKFEFIRLLLKMPYEGFYAADPPQFPAVYFLMIASTEAKAEIERRANGYISENVDHVYSLTQAEMNYLLSLGFDADWLLDSMNAGTTIIGRESAKAVLREIFRTDRRPAHTGVVRPLDQGPSLPRPLRNPAVGTRCSPRAVKTVSCRCIRTTSGTLFHAGADFSPQ